MIEILKQKTKLMCDHIIMKNISFHELLEM